MNQSSTSRRVSSPTSTGGGGTFFEQHVDAYWLAQLLVGSAPPVLIGSVVREVHFQTEYQGWHTDDFLIVCNEAGRTRRLAGQVKLGFTVSASDEECTKAIRDFWQDFKAGNPFRREDDRLVLVVSRGTETLLHHFVSLLDAAQAAGGGADFERRLAAPGFLSKTAIRYFGEVQKIVGASEGGAPSATDLWPFLRLLHVLTLDLHTSTRQTEAQIRSLLAHGVREGNPRAVAEATWDRLVSVAGDAMDTARSFRREDLPTRLQELHAELGTGDQRILDRLRDHSAVVLRGIRSTLGPALHLERASLVQRVLGELESAQAVLVTGPAGCGKSVVAKDASRILSATCPTLAFRVEEFAQPHLDVTLGAAQVGVGAETLRAILGAQPRTVVLVESVERLLEKSTREAFRDLMDQVAADRGLRLVLTCRDYSADQVQASFLTAAGIRYGVVEVPPLDDAELAEVEAALPPLAYPLTNPRLRAILRNPYFLGQALRIPWSAERPLPESEREFRALFWREIVRAESHGPAGMPRLREEAFQGVAVRRARALSAHVPGGDCDPAALEALRNDSLLDSPAGAPSFVAPAHDVLEDWAILHWLDEQYQRGERSLEELSEAVGGHPAIRRSYRAWVAELALRDSAAADRLFRAALVGAGGSAQFRDDTLVALLRASSAPEFLARHEAQLLTGDRTVLRRLIHLLRVACIAAPTLAAGASLPSGSVFNVPDGPSWAALLRLIHRNVDCFPPEEHPLLLGLIEDAVRGVSWQTPRLEGEEAVAGIAHALLSAYRDWGHKEERKRALGVLAKIPLADPERFAAVLRGTPRVDEFRDPTAEDFQDLLLTGLDGAAAARDLPDLLISVAKEYLLLTEEGFQRDRYSGHLSDLGPHFGIQEGHRQDFFPASALRGPWIPLLRHHPRKGIDFLLDIFNHSVDWYAHPRVPDPLEPAWGVELTFEEGQTRTQWANPRLWHLYRGQSVGPYVLQSLLMAMETWLLDYARIHPDTLDSTLEEILRGTDSAAIAAVVASVAISQPHAAGEALLVLLSARDYVLLDRRRMAGERTNSRPSGLLSGAEERIYEQERKGADKLAHRQQDLEAALRNLQLGPFAPRVHALIDRHLASLPPKPEQTEEDLIWRLALHRMDLRQYRIAEDATPIGDDVAGEAETARGVIALEMSAPEPDVQALADAGAAEFSEMNERLGVWVWGMGAFENNRRDHDPSVWREQLARARVLNREADYPDGSRAGPGYVAAACVRDHWAEMLPHEQDWCAEVVCSEVLRDADVRGTVARTQRYDMAADRPCAAVLPVLLQRSVLGSRVQQVRDAFAAAFTHPIDEVRAYAAGGISESFWVTDRATALRCVDVIVSEAMQVDTAWAAEAERPHKERRNVDTIIAEVRARLRVRFWDESRGTANAHQSAQLSGAFVAHAWPVVLTILGRVPEDPIAVAAFARASQALVSAWDSEHGEDAHRRDRDFHGEADIERQLQDFLMRTSREAALEVLRPVLDAVERHPREIHSILDGLRAIEDERPNTAHYWSLWSLFAERVRQAHWVAHLDQRHPAGSELMASLFMTAWWADHVRHWRSLEGYAHLVHGLFEALPPSALVLEDYLRFLYHIGERELPQAFVRLADSLQRGDPVAMLRKANAVFLLEVLLQRHVYGRPLELKQDPEIRAAVLLLLDLLVEAGSSAAFRMRDDFVTPAAGS
ncbi:MAG TPA: ATP-binding protein [Longimicrobiaceae bacterium]|nr:ATP-binding protein [Longimicrobiaceae bacterium]